MHVLTKILKKEEREEKMIDAVIMISPLVVREAVRTHYCLNNASQKIRKQKS